MINFKACSRLALLAMLALLGAAAALFPVLPAAAQAETPTPTPTVTAVPTLTGSIEEVHQLDSGNFFVVQKSFSYGELTMVAVLVILMGVVVRLNKHDKAS